jgi:hypothetical protein
MSYIDNVFEKMNNKYDDIVADYYDLKANKTIANKKRLLNDIKAFNYYKNEFTKQIKDLLFKKI